MKRTKEDCILITFENKQYYTTHASHLWDELFAVASCVSGPVQNERRAASSPYYHCHTEACEVQGWVIDWHGGVGVQIHLASYSTRFPDDSLIVPATVRTCCLREMEHIVHL